MNTNRSSKVILISFGFLAAEWVLFIATIAFSWIQVRSPDQHMPSIGGVLMLVGAGSTVLVALLNLLLIPYLFKNTPRVSIAFGVLVATILPPALLLVLFR